MALAAGFKQWIIYEKKESIKIVGKIFSYVTSQSKKKMHKQNNGMFLDINRRFIFMQESSINGVSLKDDYGLKIQRLFQIRIESI